MTDKQLSDLFAAGTAPERDPAFLLEVNAGISRARLRTRLYTLARRTRLMLLLALVLFSASRLLAPVLAQLAGLPQFMGVPLPLVLLGLVLAGFVLRGGRQLSFLR